MSDVSEVLRHSRNVMGALGFDSLSARTFSALPLLEGEDLLAEVRALTERVSSPAATCQSPAMV